MEKSEYKYIESLFKTGAVLSTSINIWSAKKKMSSDFLGIPESEVNHDLVTFGSMWLLPKSEIADLEKIRGQANKLIEAYGFPFYGFGRFVSNKKEEELNRKMTELREQFNEKVEYIKANYEEMTSKLRAMWQLEAAKIASRRNDPDAVFEVMAKVAGCFKPWEVVESRFQFKWSFNHDLNYLAIKFVEDGTRAIMDKMKEFAERLKVKIEESNLDERNLKPIREYIEALRDGMMVFENQELNKFLEDMEAWVQDGTAEDVAGSSKLAGMMTSSMDNIIRAAENQVDEISKAGVEAILSYGRKIEK